MINRLVLTLLFASLMVGALTCIGAAQDDHATWDVTLPRGATREIDFVTAEGTWMAVDISSDGRWILFDLLGHIYRVPAEGGEAECLTQESGIAINFHPRYSPHGREIAFVSDRKGQMNLWVMKAEGSSPEPVFLDLDTRITEPSWTPDGQHIVAVRNFQTTVGIWRRSARIWMFPRYGGEPHQLVGQPYGTQAFWPSVAPDGESLYYFYATFAAVTTAFGQDQHIRRLDLRSGGIQIVTPAQDPRNASWAYHSPDPAEIAPEISPDGRWLAFARRMPGGSITYRSHIMDERTALWLKDLHTGDERVVMDPITADMATTHQMKNFTVLPRYTWAKDGKSIVLSQGGKLRRLWIESGKVTTIPFRARVHRIISEQARSTLDISDDPFELRFLRWISASPQGDRLVFEGLGRLWTMDLPDGEPQRLTSIDPEVRELTPSWSPDGRWIAFATWDDFEQGHLWKIRPDGESLQRLTNRAARYLSPEWSPDGSHLIVSRLTDAVIGDWRSGLVRISPEGGSQEWLRGGAAGVKFGPEGRIFFTAGRANAGGREQWTLEQGLPDIKRWVSLLSVDPEGGNPREELTLHYAQEVVTSPDGKWVAHAAGQNLYLSRMPGGRGAGGVAEIDLERATLVGPEGAFSPRWRDANRLEFTSGNRHFTYHLDSGHTDTVEIHLTVPRDIPRGTIALTGGRVVTIDDRQVIEKGTVVVAGSRITCVGECDVSQVDHSIDVTGKTIVPGFGDTHAHYLGDGPIIPQRRSRSALFLAYGVTTALDPSTPSLSAFPIAELTRAGKLVGPRAFATAEAMNSTPPRPPGGPRVPNVRTYEDAQHYVNRLANWGAVSVKQFLTPRRQQRQWLVDAARKRGLSVTAEGADLYYAVSMLMDGHTGWEHPLHYAPLYSDAAKFLAQAGAHYSSTMLVLSGGPWMEEYFRARSDLWNDPKQRRFVPWLRLARSKEYVTRPASGYRFPFLAEGFADVVRAGGHSSLGGHGEEPGLDTHWELWGAAFALTPMEALEVATGHGAHMAGLEDDLGSIEVGKLADLLVLNSNPLDDIRNTVDLLYVMKGGTLYEADTLDEVWPDQTPYGPIPWADEGPLRTDTVPLDVWDRDQ